MTKLARICMLFLLGLTAVARSRELGRRFLSEEPDHLCKPLQSVSESPSLIEVRTHEKTLLSLTKQDSGNYLLRAQRIDWVRIAEVARNNGAINEYPYQAAQIEIPEELAKSLTHLWLHELQRVPTDEKAWMGFDGMSWFFTARLPDGGGASGFIWSPRREAPPLWLVRASDALIDHVFDSSNQSHLNDFRKYADMIIRYGETSKAAPQQGGAGQPATRPESKSEGGDKPQPEAEGRSR